MTDSGELIGKYGLTRLLTKLWFRYDHPSLVQHLHGITFSNPVGLSAGFDKDIKLVNTLHPVGFGFMSVGSVTWKAYQGNPKPRLYRLPKSKGLVVYYGLKNHGVDALIPKLRNRDDHPFPLFVSVAKTNCDSTATEAGGIKDYQECLKALNRADVGDVYEINISCPNTFGGEPFTTAPKLEKLLPKLISVKPTKPVFIKMPINLPWKDFESLLKVIVANKVTGVIIGNLTKDRSSKLIKDVIPEHVKGGISGKPCYDLSNQLIAKTYKAYGGKLTIVGVGGIFSAEDAYTKIKLGASLVQLITGMIYQGPQLIGQINQGLVELMRQDGFNHISQAVGADLKK